MTTPLPPDYILWAPWVVGITWFVYCLGRSLYKFGIYEDVRRRCRGLARWLQQLCVPYNRRPPAGHDGDPVDAAVQPRPWATPRRASYAERTSPTGRLAPTSFVVRSHNATVAMADLAESLRAAGVDTVDADRAAADRAAEMDADRRAAVAAYREATFGSVDAEPPTPQADGADADRAVGMAGHDGLIGLDFARVEARAAAYYGVQEGVANIPGPDHDLLSGDSTLAHSVKGYVIRVYPHPPTPEDLEHEDCDLWVNTGTRPATFMSPDDGEWVEIAAPRTPFHGALMTLDRQDDVYVTVTTTVVPGLRDHLPELEGLSNRHLTWDSMSPELVMWFGGLTRRERTFVLSTFGADAYGAPPRRPGRRPVRDLDLG